MHAFCGCVSLQTLRQRTQPAILLCISTVSSRWSLENLAGECLQTRFAGHGLLDTVYPLREHLNNAHVMVSGECCGGALPDTFCWARLRSAISNTCRRYGSYGLQVPTKAQADFKSNLHASSPTSVQLRDVEKA